MYGNFVESSNLKTLFIAAEVSAQAVALAKLAETVTDEDLKSSLNSLVSTLTDLSSSLAGLENLLAKGRRVKRTTTSNNHKYLCQLILNSS